MPKLGQVRSLEKKNLSLHIQLISIHPVFTLLTMLELLRCQINPNNGTEIVG